MIEKRPRPALNGDLHQTWPGKRWYHKPGPWCRTKARMGRRGAMMMLLGITYILIGYGDASRPVPDIAGAWHLSVDPLVRGLFWAATGFVAVAFAIVRPHETRPYPWPVAGRRPPVWWNTDTPGWISLYLAPTLVISSFARSWFLALVADSTQIPLPGDIHSWYNAVLRIPFVLIVLICSGWLENPRQGCRP